MKGRILIAITLIALIGVFTSCSENVLDDTKNQGSVLDLKSSCGETLVTDLVAGQNIVVGNVTTSFDGINLIVSYNITEDGWLLKETHLAVEENFSDIPVNKKGNPKIGNFEYGDEFNIPQTNATYTINVEGLSLVYIAAHAVVGGLEGTECETVADIEVALPDYLVDISFLIKKIDYYYDVTLSNAGAYNGVYPSWCIDNNGKPVDYSQAMLVSSYSETVDLSASVVNPDNLDLLNYLMNNYVETHPFKVVQAAIWVLMNGSYTNGTGGIYLSAAQLTEMNNVVNEVVTNGEGFVPVCGQNVVVIIDSQDRFRYQNAFILVPLKEVPYYEEETAWANGINFNGGSWAMYFSYCF